MAEESVNRDFALVGAKIYSEPSVPPFDHGIVVVRDGIISAVGRVDRISVPKGIAVIDCVGLVICAGFQNSHIHFTDPIWADAAEKPAQDLARQLRGKLTRFGFTTVVDTGSLLANTLVIRRRIEAREIAGPYIITAGTPLYPINGVPYYVRAQVPPEMLPMLEPPKTPAEATALVAAHVEQGAGIIKLFTGSWVDRDTIVLMRPDVASAAVAEAHRLGELVFSHASNFDGFRIALSAHVDVLAHAVEDTTQWKDSYAREMIAAKMALVPTLYLFRQSRHINDILKEVTVFSDAGGKILFGTDAGFIPDYDPSGEYALMKKAGMSFSQILASLTTTPAEIFHVTQTRGRIVPGFMADLVALKSDPNDDITAFARVRYTWRGGRMIFDEAIK